MYENVLFIRGKLKKLTNKTQEKVACKPASAVDRSRSPTAMASCANNLLATLGSVTCCLQMRLHINRPNLQHNRPIRIN